MNNALENVKPEDLQEILQIIYEQGWQIYSIKDLELILKTSADMCFKLIVDGHIVGCIFALCDVEITYISFFLIKKENRNIKLSTEIGELCMQKAINRSKLIIIYANYRAINVYKKKGFMEMSDFSRYRFSGFKNNMYTGIFECGINEMNDLADLNKICYKSERLHLTREIFNLQEARCFLYKSKQGQVKGYAFIHKSCSQYVIGPLVALDDEVAAKLFMGVLDSVDNKKVIADANEQKFNKFIRDLGIPFEKLTVTVRKMYIGNSDLLENENYLYIISGHHFS